jgi:hypothetical protein
MKKTKHAHSRETIALVKAIPDPRWKGPGTCRHRETPSQCPALKESHQIFDIETQMSLVFNPIPIEIRDAASAEKQCCQLLAKVFCQINRKIRPLTKKFGRTTSFL